MTNKIKLYLDTNTVIDFFIGQAIAVKKGEEATIPEKFKFFVKNLDRIEFYTSVLTKTEVARELIAGLGVSENYLEELWDEFMKILDCNFIGSVTIDNRLANIACKVKMKLRTLVNFQHLFVAMDRKLYLLSGDKDLIRIVRENKIYDKILSYIDLRKLISSSSPNL
jgi:hypothetical protein